MVSTNLHHESCKLYISQHSNQFNKKSIERTNPIETSLTLGSLVSIGIDRPDLDRRISIEAKFDRYRPIPISDRWSVHLKLGSSVRKVCTRSLSSQLYWDNISQVLFYRILYLAHSGMKFCAEASYCQYPVQHQPFCICIGRHSPPRFYQKAIPRKR